MKMSSTRRFYIALLYGLTCHLLFATSVATMIFAMFFGLSRSPGQLHAPLSWVANGLLILQFPLTHSFLLTRRGRAVLRSLAPSEFAADLETTSYVIIASCQVLLLFLLWSPSGVIWWQAEGATRMSFCCLYAGAWLLLLKSIWDAGFALQTGFLGWRALLRNTRPIYPGMPTAGVFRACRQPIYLSFALTLWTVPTWTPDQLFLASSLTVYCVVGPLFKETRFRRLFGEEFEAFARGVPYFLPWPRPGSQCKSNGSTRVRNDLSVYETFAGVWWNGSQRWLRILQGLVVPRLKWFGDRVGDWQGKSVLDLGCGGGFMAEALAARGAQVVAVDPSEAAISIAKHHAALNEYCIDYRVGVGENLPVASKRFDCVVCVDVLEHVDDVDSVLKEIGRVLKPGGLLLFDTINRTKIASLIYVTLGERLLRVVPRGAHDPIKFIRPSELRTKLLEHGFSGWELTGLGPRGLNRKLDVTFGSLPTTAFSYMGCAMKPHA